jgi:predicted dehydrogenase
MRQINVGLIGTGWCGGIRARTTAASPYVNEVHISEVNPERLAEVAAQTNAVTATVEWEPIANNPAIDAVIISATPESTHYPMAKACLEAGKHVLLEKPIALTLDEADELIEIARSKNLKFTIGYSQRFNVKQALVKQRIEDGTLGEEEITIISPAIEQLRAEGHDVSGPFAMAVFDRIREIKRDIPVDSIRKSAIKSLS